MSKTFFDMGAHHIPKDFIIPEKKWEHMSYGPYYSKSGVIKFGSYKSEDMIMGKDPIIPQEK